MGQLCFESENLENPPPHFSSPWKMHHISSSCGSHSNNLHAFDALRWKITCHCSQASLEIMLGATCIEGDAMPIVDPLHYLLWA